MVNEIDAFFNFSLLKEKFDEDEITSWNNLLLEVFLLVFPLSSRKTMKIKEVKSQNILRLNFSKLEDPPQPKPSRFIGIGRVKSSPTLVSNIGKCGIQEIEAQTLNFVCMCECMR